MNVKDGARERLAAAETELLALSRRIHGRPELAFEEEHAVGWIADVLDAGGFRVERGVCDLPTAFVARAGSGPLHVAICAEYDALPDIGHACGHNVIAALAVGAGLAAARVADEVGLTVSVFGTPAEESGGGKIILLERGAFDDVHAAMMAHPAPLDVLEPPTLAFAEFEAHFHGKASHASAAPELGVNAADALVIAQTAIGLLRQHLRPGDRVHGIVTRGGEAPNVVPAHTAATYLVRARDLAPLGEPYADVRHDAELAAVYRRNAEALGRYFPDVGPLLERAAGSTDLGNVSQVLPAIHPAIGIGSFPAVNHQPEFAAHCVTELADTAVLQGAIALAWTAVDLATDATLSARLRGAP